ncbi:11107_t:CDS:1, partial [Racocetra persica]
EKRPYFEYKRHNIEYIVSTKIKKRGPTKKEQKNYLLLKNILN